MQESAANNVGAKIRVRNRDAGGVTVSLETSLKDPAGSLPDSGLTYSAVAGTWRLLATSRLFAAFRNDGANPESTLRCCVLAGTLYVPSFLTLTTTCGFIWGCGNADADATSSRIGWRRTPRTDVSGNPYIFASMMGSAAYSTLGGLSSWQGGASNVDQHYRWEDNTVLAYEPLISGGVTEPKIHGQLYDACLVNGARTSETTFALDGHTWIALTVIIGSQSATSSLNFLLT